MNLSKNGLRNKKKGATGPPKQREKRGIFFFGLVRKVWIFGH
jgi:hypothetical protein